MAERMWYVNATIGSEDDTTYVDGYVLSETRPSVRRWMKSKLPAGYRILETQTRVCPAINRALLTP